jgi:hypothetical protein
MISCCSEYTVYINPSDALLIHRILQIPLETFVESEPLSEETHAYKPYSFLLGEKTRYLLKLKKRGNFCLFLLRLNRQGRCGIHGFRPAVCRCYPFEVKGNRVKVVPEALCQSPWNLSSNQEKEFIDHYKSWTAGYVQAKRMMDLWNQPRQQSALKRSGKPISPRTGFRQFLRFLTTEKSHS